VLNPVPGLEDTIADNKAKKLEAYKNSLDSKAIISLVKATADFKKWQGTADTPEALSSMPRLSIKDITPELPNLQMNVTEQSGVKVLSHNVNLNGVSSISLYFDTSKVPQEKLHYLMLLSSLLGSIDTKNYKYQDLITEASLNTSGITFVPTAIQNYKSDLYSPKMGVSFIAVDDNIPKALDIVEEIINNTSFDNKERIKQIIDQNLSMMQQMYTFGTGITAISNASAYLSEAGRYSEELTGVSYYKFLEDLSKNFDNRWSDLSNNLKETSSLVFNKNGLIAGQSGDSKITEIFKKELMQRLVDKLNDKALETQKYTFKAPQKNTAFPIPVKVQTIVEVGNFAKEGYTYSGKMMVLERILTMDYLWNKVRATGGAYSVNASFGQDGSAILMSASDPNLTETLDAFKGVVDFLKNFDANPDEMENYIIGTIGEFMKLKSMGPLYEGAIGESLYLTGMPSDDLLKMEKEALSTTAQDIRDYGTMLEKIIKQNAYFIEGSQEKIDANKDIFDKIETLDNLQ
jgi:Zn-dependent M16 (insulinase) family peptidase